MNQQKDLTARQKEVMKLIFEYQQQTNKIPSLVYLSEKMGITLSGVAQKINCLKRKGIIERQNIYLLKI